jgi:hypothetical protein
MSKLQKQQQQTTLLDILLCGFCEQPGAALKLCAACGAVSYCSAACQGAHWADHKPKCKLLRKDKAKAAAQGSGSGSGGGLEDMGVLLNVLMQPKPQSPYFDEIDVWNACCEGKCAGLQKMLLQRGRDVDWVDPDDGIGSTAASVAADKGHADCLSLMIQNGADVLKSDKDGSAPIHMACLNGRYACVELLLDSGVDVSLRTATEYESTPVIVACQYGHVKILALLLARGADLNLADRYGNTATHVASRCGQLKCIQLLVKRGADLNQKDEDGESPLDIARRFKHPECVNLLLSNGALGTDVEDLPSITESDEVRISCLVLSLRHTSVATLPHFIASTLPSCCITQEEEAVFVQKALSRQVDARRCDYPPCQASAADLNLPRLKKCPRCDVGRYPIALT